MFYFNLSDIQEQLFTGVVYKIYSDKFRKLQKNISLAESFSIMLQAWN